MMTARDGCFIIGVHQAGDPKTRKNWGIVFWDDKGLSDIFGYKKLADFMARIRPYKPKNRIPMNETLY